jgi:membrane-associated protease RseP (regulator of RpoE activity)
VSNHGYSQPDEAYEGGDFYVPSPPQPWTYGTYAPVRDRYWLHVLLLLLTFLTTTVVGAGLWESFSANSPYAFDALGGYIRAWQNPAYLLKGLPFSITLLAILLAHEMGHYLTALVYGVDVSLPYFLPAPTLIGTMGAFIKIRSAIQSKRALFDIGIGGPLAGFVVLVGPLTAGIALSRHIPGVVNRGDLILGNPLLMRLLEAIIFPGVPSGDISLHPVARAAWAGLLATALNLLPIGQLDGGHILYAFAGERTRLLSRVFVGGLAALGIYQLVVTHYANGYTWLLWSGLLLAFGMRHPAIYDPRPMGRLRAWLGFAALVIFILAFTVSPARTNGL